VVKGKYEVEFTNAAAKELRKLSKSIQPKLLRGIRDTINTLAFEPRPPGVEKLEGTENLWRVRSGDYRIVYTVEDDVLTVLVVMIRHRREVYRAR
jgi:mRNA interferase RelE/StbE